MNRVERLEKALEVAEKALTLVRDSGKVSFLAYQSCATSALAEIDKIKTPPPAYEDVEVVRWSSGSCQDIFMTEDEASDPRNCVGQVVKLTGTYKRPLPSPVEKMTHGIAADGSVVLDIGDQPPKGTHCVVLWEEGGDEPGLEVATPLSVDIEWHRHGGSGVVFPSVTNNVMMDWNALVGCTGTLIFKEDQ